MTHRLPPDVDRLLWEVAESQDPKAFDDFEVRFPHLVGELGQRIKLVREFRGARRETSNAPRAPMFDYREPSSARPIGRLAWASGAVILAALGFTAFLVTKEIMPRPAPKPSEIVRIPEPTPSPIEKREAPAQTQHSLPSVVTNEPANPDTTYVGPKWEQKQNVKFPHEQLQTVLAAVAYEGGLNIVFAPNTPNPEIAMDYHGMNSVEIIQDLGRKFGFSAMKNGPADLLIVPARDPNAKDAAVTGSGIATNLDAQPPTDVPPLSPTKDATKNEPAKAKPSRIGPL